MIDAVYVPRVPLILLLGFGLSVLGTLTTTDAISLRAVFHDVPLLSTFILTARLGLGTNLAHTLEPVCALLGFGVMLLPIARLREPMQHRRAEPQTA